MSRIADTRAAWNAVERLAITGEVTMAVDLAALLEEPRVAVALAAVAEDAGTTGGTLCARDAAEQAIEANQKTYVAIVDTAAHDGRISVMAGPPFPAPGGWTYQDATGPHCVVLVESADRDEAQSALDAWLADCPAKRGGRCCTHGDAQPLATVPRLPFALWLRPMISDTLSDAIAEIDRYLSDPVFAGAYAEADVRAHIDRVRVEMEALRVRLDEVAPASEPQTCCDVTGCDSVATIEDVDGRHVCAYHGDAP